MRYAIVLLCVPTVVSAQSPEELLAQFKAGLRLCETEGDEKGAAVCAKALNTAIRLYGADHEEVAYCQRDLALIYLRLEQYKKAEPLFKAAIATGEKLGGRDHLEVALTQVQMGLLYSGMGDYGKAEDYYMRGLATAQTKLGRDHPQTALGYMGLADLYLETGKPAEAAKWCFPALHIYETKLGKHEVQTGYACLFVARYYQQLGEYAKAEEHYLRTLTIYEKKLGKTDLTTALALNNLTTLYMEMGQYTKGLQLITRAIEFGERQVEKDHPGLAIGLHNQAALFMLLGKYEQAEATYLRSLTIHETKLGKDSPRVAQNLVALGELQRLLGQYAKAEPLLTRALTIMEQRYGEGHPATTHNLLTLALLERKRERYAPSENYYKRALAVAEGKLGKEHPHTATALMCLAELYAVQGKHETAEPLYTRALNIYAKRFTKEHPHVGIARKNLGELYHAMGQYKLADNQLETAVALLKGQLGDNHPETAQALSTRAAAYFAAYQPDSALKMQDAAMQSLRRHTVDVVPILAEHEQLAFLQSTHDKRLAVGLSMGLQPKLTDAQRQQVATWLLNSKAVAVDVLSELQLQAREADTPEAKALLAELAEVRRQRAALTLQTEKTRSTATITALAAQEKQLTTKLKQFDKRAQQEATWWTGADIAKQLPAKSVFVDVARFAVFDFAAGKSGEEHYIAFVTTRTVTSVVDLGPAQTIDTAVKRVRQELEAASKAITQKGEAEAEKQLREVLTPLAKLVLTPLRKYLDEAEEWLLSPDSNLWLVPWAILPLDAQTYAIEKHRLRYVVSGRDLLTTAASDRAPTGPIIVADPDFDAGAARKTPPAPLRGLRLGSVQRLPGTAVEAEAIAPRLAVFAGKAPDVVTEKDATATFVAKVQRPSVLVLSTHGFFLPDEGPTRDNPLLRCGLLLAGCNQGARDTGVLRGTQIVGCDLRGTKLVVLSACETGLGDVQNGQGVAGLRQAFQRAGAASVVATLWQIPDQESALLMVRYFDGLAKGQTHGTALQNAQRETIQKRRDRFAAAHPFFWGAYTLTGRDQ